MRLALSLAAIACLAAAPAQLRVSSDGRYLVDETGKPFTYLGDTAWELIHRLDRDEAEFYLRNRSSKGFTVIQTVVLAELDGLRAPTPAGLLPLTDNDPTKPNEDYFRHVDWVVERANQLGLVVGLLPTWGDKVGPLNRWGIGPEIFNTDNAAKYGEYVGRRYKDRSVIFILGGDRDPDTPERVEIWKAMGRGLHRGCEGRHLISFHPGANGKSSSSWFHDEPWLSFNMWQNGHSPDVPVWNHIAQDYAKTPTKPVVDGEPMYEDHPLGFRANQFGHSTAADVRRYPYYDMLSGACGVTYGHQSVWQMYNPAKHKPTNGAAMHWREAIDRPAAGQMRHLKALIESRPIRTRVPAPDIVLSDKSAGSKRVYAARCAEGTFAFVYNPVGRAVTVALNDFRGGIVRAWRFDPRTGQAERLNEYPKSKGSVTITPPHEGENWDWVLVLDSIEAGYPPPGQPFPQPIDDAKNRAR